MKLRFFLIPAAATAEDAHELNAFLASNRIRDVDRRFVDCGAASFWAICVTFVDGAGALLYDLFIKEQIATIAPMWMTTKAAFEPTKDIGTMRATREFRPSMLETRLGAMGDGLTTARHSAIRSSVGDDRVLRGGSWNTNARNVRAANRNANDPGNRNDNIGLRLARAHTLAVAPASDPTVVQTEAALAQSRRRRGEERKLPGALVGARSAGEGSPGSDLCHG